MCKHELIPLSESSQWQKELEGIPHAFAHTWDSCYAMYLTHGKDTYLYTFRDGDVRIVCPIVERDFEGYKDVATPFGISGFVGTKPYPGFREKWIKFATNRNYVCGYFSLNPLFTDTSYYRSAEAYVYNEVFIQDLSRPIEEIFTGFSKNRKRYLKQSWMKNEGKITLDREKLAKFFIENYHAFMKRCNASSAYDFSYDTLSALVNTENLIITGIEDEGSIVAVSLFPYTSYMSNYLFNIHCDSGRAFSTSLIWQGIIMLKELEIPYLDYGGGHFQDDPRNQFKKSFHPDKFLLTGLKQVYDVRVYEALCREASIDPDTRIGYFPGYHAFNRLAAQLE